MAMPQRSFLTRYRCQLHAVVLGTIPMVLGFAGAVIDELTRLGFSTWRTACREAGATLVSLFTFTIQLMPTAVAGVLAGGLLVLIAGAIRRDRQAARRHWPLMAVVLRALRWDCRFVSCRCHCPWC